MPRVNFGSILGIPIGGRIDPANGACTTRRLLATSRPIDAARSGARLGQPDLERGQAGHSLAVASAMSPCKWTSTTVRRDLEWALLHKSCEGFIS